ncbi:MAG: type III-B CRISPR module RAMP protein Cmr1 [Thermogutta sp.]
MPKSSEILPCPGVPLVKTRGQGIRQYQISLITPMFGGGVTARVNDMSFPVRPTAIRGQLQFWWRATVGARYATRQELRAAQSAVWGDTTRASRVQVRVANVQAEKPQPCAQFEGDRNRPGLFRSSPTWNARFRNTALPYALFPFQGQLTTDRKQVEIKPAYCIDDAGFQLQLICPDDLWTEVEAALWAWVNFGGLGSRTRRGCGAVVCKDFAPKDCGELSDRLKPFLQENPAAREWPTLAAACLIGRQPKSPIESWNAVIELLQRFRQGVDVGRNQGRERNRPGRSRWPEPETIRRATKQRLPKHARLKYIPDDAFPRAELGLPIVFHFQERGDPPDTVLYPDNDSEGQKRERMASPLILRPLALQDGKTIPLILWMRTPALTGVDLRRGDTSLSLPPTTVIRDPRLAGYQGSPLAGSPKGSAIEAFLTFALGAGFKELK